MSDSEIETVTSVDSRSSSLFTPEESTQSYSRPSSLQYITWEPYNMVTYEQCEEECNDSVVTSRHTKSSSGSSTLENRLSSDRSNGDGSLCSAVVTSSEEEEEETEEEVTEEGGTSVDEAASISGTVTSAASSMFTSDTSQQDNHSHHSSEANFVTFITEPAPDSTGSDAATGYITVQQMLLKGVENGDMAIVKRNLTQRKGFNFKSSCDQYERTLLHISCSLGHLDIVKFLIMAGHPVDVSSLKRQTPLMEACIGGHSKIVQLLVPEVGDLDHVDEVGRSAAHYCALHGEVKCLNVLCDHGSDICLEDTLNRTCVHYAAMKNHPVIIQCLMERGAELEAVDKDGQTPAHYAAHYNSLDCLEMLLRSAVDITQGDIYGMLPVHKAAYYDRIDCLKLLLKKGRTKCSDVDHKGRNVLHKAAQGNAATCLHWVLSTGRLEPNTVDSHGNTGLHYSSAGGHPEIYYCLLQHGADTSCLNKDGLNPLDMARKHGKALCIQRATDGQVTCSMCEKEANYKDKPYRTKFNQKLKASQEALFLLEGPVADSSKKPVDHFRYQKSNPSTKVSFSHLLAAKYYGPSP